MGPPATAGLADPTASPALARRIHVTESVGGEAGGDGSHGLSDADATDGPLADARTTLPLPPPPAHLTRSLSGGGLFLIREESTPPCTPVQAQPPTLTLPRVADSPNLAGWDAAALAQWLATTAAAPAVLAAVAPVFAAHGLTGRDLLDLSDADLASMGVASAAVRAEVLAAVAATLEA